MKMKLKEKRKMFVKGISTENFSKNCLGESFNKSLRMRTMTILERYPQFTSEGSPIFYQNSVASFREQKSFVLKIDYFTRIRLTHM